MEPDRQAARSVLAAFLAAAAYRSELEEPRVVQQLGAAVARTLVAQAPVARQAAVERAPTRQDSHSSNDWIAVSWPFPPAAGASS